MSKDQTFADYISSESDFIDIFIQQLSSQLEHLPYPLSYNPYEGLDLRHQLESNYNQLILEQFREFIDTLYFLKEIMINIHRERGGSSYTDETQGGLALVNN